MFGTPCMPNVAALSFGVLASHFKPAAKNLGVTLDSWMKCDRLILLLKQASQLILLAKLKPFFNRHELEKAIRAFIIA